MTAVQWLVEQLEIFATEQEMNIIEKAKEMERQQITDSYKIGARYALISQSDLALIKGKFPTPEQYYNETFNNK